MFSKELGKLQGESLWKLAQNPRGKRKKKKAIFLENYFGPEDTVWSGL